MGALGAGPASDPGRDHARRPAPHAVPALHRAGRGGPQVGRRRPRVHRLLDGARRPVPGSLPPGSRRGGPAAGRAWHALRRLPRAGGGVGGVDHPAHPLRRAGPLHHVRHRGDPPGHPPGARLHGPAQGREVHRPLPRLARRGLRGGEPALRRADVGRDPRRGPRRGPARPAQRHRGARAAPREPQRYRRRHPRAERRAGRRLPDRPRIPEGPPSAHSGPRHGAHLRRGHHRVPIRTRRRPGVLRRDAGHDDARQDRCGRAPGRRRLRAARHRRA